MRAVVRRWWWIPIPLLALLLVMAWVVAGMLQDRARTLAANAAGIDEERVEMVDGLNVRLTGFTDEASRDAAVASVDALDATWEVVGIVDGEGAAGPAGTENAGAATDGATAETTDAAPTTAAGTAGPEPTTEDDAVPATVAPTEPASVELEVAADGGLVVRGTVGDEARRAVIIAEAERFAGEGNVTDELVVEPGGVVEVGGTLTIAGDVASEDQRQALLDTASSVAVAAGFDLVDDVAVNPAADTEQPAADETVSDELNALFELEPIEFDYNTATVRSESIATLDAAAATINASPAGTVFRVVGHTDSDGDADDNLRLSQARADAVVAYLVDVGGVDEARLDAEGRGETQLKIDPEATSNDKQRNRRIEWERAE